MESKLCMNCFAGYQEQDGNICPVCGWDNAKSQVPEGLGYHTLLNSRYFIGRAKAMNGEGITYAALDRTTKKVVEVREFYPASLVFREENKLTLTPFEGHEAEFSRYLDDFLKLSKNVSRLKEATVVASGLEVFEENGTAYAVYEYIPSVSLRKFLVNSGGKLSWNEVNLMFSPVVNALGLMNSLGMPHLGISLDTLRVTKEKQMLITGFSILAARRRGTPIIEELYPGCAAIEQYGTRSGCGEVSDVYAVAAVMLACLTGALPKEAPKRLEDQRLMISKEVLKTLPPFVVTALANALQVKQENRTASFERLKAELSAAPTIVTEIEHTDAIRRIPIDMGLPRSKGLPPVVWLVASCLVTLVALVIVASIWLGDRGMSFRDIQQLFQNSSSLGEEIEVPRMVDESYEEWAEKLSSGNYGFELRVSTREFNDSVAEGNIISQTPFAGEKIQPGGTVLVTVSKGSATRTLPEVKGANFAELSAALSKMGFSPVKEEVSNEDVETGYVIGYQDHKEGDSLEYGSTVVVLVSAGPESS